MTGLFLQRRMKLHTLLMRLWSVMELSRVLFKQCLQFVPQGMRHETVFILYHNHLNLLMLLSHFKVKENCPMHLIFFAANRKRIKLS